METASLLGQGLVQMVKFGPFLNARLTLASAYALPQGFVATGAACSITAVEADDALGQARVTALMVRLGFLNYVRDVTVYLCDREHSDVVAAITAGLLQLKEIDIVRQINDALIAEGHVATGAKIGGSMMTQGYDEMAEIAKQSAAESAGDSEIVKDIKKKGADIMSAFTSDKDPKGTSTSGAQQKTEQAGKSSKDVAHDSTEQAGSMLGGIKDSARQLASDAQDYIQGAGSSSQTAAH